MILLVNFKVQIVYNFKLHILYFDQTFLVTITFYYRFISLLSQMIWENIYFSITFIGVISFEISHLILYYAFDNFKFRVNLILFVKDFELV